MKPRRRRPERTFEVDMASAEVRRYLLGDPRSTPSGRTMTRITSVISMFGLVEADGQPGTGSGPPPSHDDNPTPRLEQATSDPQAMTG